MVNRINWKKRIAEAESINEINLKYCFLHDVGYGEVEGDKFYFDKEINKFWFDRELTKVYRDADSFSVNQYRYYQIFLDKKLPNKSENKFIIQKTNSLELSCINESNLTLSCDYIGPIKKHYYRMVDCDTKKLSEMLFKTRKFAGSMVWPNTSKGALTVNQCKGLLLKDRMDLTLLNLKEYYDSGYTVSECSCKQLGKAFENHKEWYEQFCSFEQFIQYFYLNDFVNEEYEITTYNSYEEYLKKIEGLIEKREITISKNMT